MQLSLQTFTSLVQNMAAAVQAAANQLVDLTVGSTLRAVLEANASIALWMQWLILLVLRNTRAATSSGDDLDSWMGDFAVTRLPAVAATGIVTLSRITPGIASVIPPGALVRTADGTQIFLVIVDTANSAWSLAANGYVVSAGVVAVNVPVTAQTPGIAGNVQAAAVSLLASALPGIDAVTNANAFQNGREAEADGDYRARFQSFLVSRSRATLLSVGYAIDSIQQGLSYTIQENVDPSGQLRLGSFVVTVDDGSGHTSSALLTTVQIAVEAVRPIGSMFMVQPPSVTLANVALTLSVSSGVDKASVASLVGTLIADYVNDLAIGAPLPLTRLPQIAYSASPDVENVSQILINGDTADLLSSASEVIKAGVIAVN